MAKSYHPDLPCSGCGGKRVRGSYCTPCSSQKSRESNLRAIERLAPCARCKEAPKGSGSYCHPCAAEYARSRKVRKSNKNSRYFTNHNCSRCGINPREQQSYCKPCVSLKNKERRAKTFVPKRVHCVEIFWSKVAFAREDECWEWQGVRDRKGYGVFNQKKASKILAEGSAAHRIAYTLEVDIIPEGLSVLHSCDNPPCVNPAHLRTGTLSDNMLDMIVRNRRMSFTPIEIAEQIAQSGLPRKEIADTFGVSLRVVHHIKGGDSWTHLNVPVVQVPDAHRKMSPEQVREIRNNPQIPLSVFAKKFGFSSVGPIQQVRTFKTYLDVL